MNNIFYKYRFLFVIVTFLSVIFSCKKSLQEESKPYDGTRVSFKIAGVKTIDSPNKYSSVNGGGLNPSSIEISNKKQEEIGSNVSVQVVEDLGDISTSISSIREQILSEGFGSSNKMASNRPITPSTKFRVVVLNANGEVVSSSQANVSQVVNVDLEVGKQYTWYAYSYDDSDDIPELPVNEIIETPTDKDFLYAKSTTPLTAVAGENPINILFEHQLAVVSLELDYDRLFAEIPTNSVNDESISNSFNWGFENTPNFLYKGKFSLRSGQVSNQEVYVPNINESLKNHPTSENIKVARLYTVQPPAGSTPSNVFKVSINSLKVRFPNTPDGQTVNLTQNVSPSNTFANFSNTPGHMYVAKFKLWYTFPKLNILHVTRSNDYSYAAQPRNLAEGGSTYDALPGSNQTSFNMIKADRNYGLLENSLVRTNGFGHRRLSHNFRIDTALNLAGGSGIAPPDIVIIATYYEMDQNDAEALRDYVNRGGVLFLMSDGVNTSDYTSHRQFFKLLFNDNNVTSDKSGFSGGSMYRLADINDEILNGPFGDARKKHWGEDATATIALQNYPQSEVIEYSESVPDNSLSKASTGATMIRHRNKHFFWVGDGGFIACDLRSGSHGSPSNPTGTWASWANQPFATATPSNQATHLHPYPYLSTHYEFFPVPRPYGYEGNSLSRYHFGAYNSTVFANFMSWAVVNATFFGINTGGLKPGSYKDF